MVDHEHCAAALELDQTAEFFQWLVAGRKLQALGPFLRFEIFILVAANITAPSGEIDERQAALHQHSDIVVVCLGQLLVGDGRVVVIIRRAYLDADAVGRPHLEDRIQHLEGKSAAILDRSAILVLSQVGSPTNNR